MAGRIVLPDEVKRWTPAQIREAYNSPVGVAKLAFPDFDDAPHTWLLSSIIAKQVEAAANPKMRSDMRKVTVSTPPRSSKSLMCDVFGTVYALGRVPSLSIILVSRAASLAEDFSRDARDYLRYVGPRVFGVTIDPSSEARDQWSVVDVRDESRPLGGMLAGGEETTWLGKGASMLIVDDFNRPDDSPETRRKLVSTYYKSLKTRLNRGGTVLIIGQRMGYADDLIGSVLATEGLRAQNGSGFVPYVLPYEAEEGGLTSVHIPGLIGSLPDLLNRRPGERLWPGWDSEEAIADKKSDPLTWLGAYQQHNVVAAEGAIFNRDLFRRYEEQPAAYALHLGGYNGEAERTLLVGKAECSIFQTVDIATSLKSQADFFVVSTFARCPDGRLLLLSVRRGRFDAPNQERVMFEEYAKWTPSTQYVDAHAYGLSFSQLMLSKGLPIKPHTWPKGENKLTAARTAAERVAAEMILIPFAASWLPVWLAEIGMAGNNPAHDDQIDTLSMAAGTVLSKSLTDRAIRTISGADDDDPGPGWKRVGVGRWTEKGW